MLSPHAASMTTANPKACGLTIANIPRLQASWQQWALIARQPRCCQAQMQRPSNPATALSIPLAWLPQSTRAMVTLTICSNALATQLAPNNNQQIKDMTTITTCATIYNVHGFITAEQVEICDHGDTISIGVAEHNKSDLEITASSITSKIAAWSATW